MRNAESSNRQLLDRLRVGEEILDADVDKLMSLRLDNIESKHGKAYVDDIKSKAMYLYYGNEKRQQHNLRALIQQSSPENPVAIVRSRSAGTVGKGVKAHFDSDLPSASLLCVGAKVAISNRNFCPEWGLYNGACGIVKEIIFDKGGNPNLGSLPLYVVVDFPLYHGPPWDIDNPTVSQLKRSVW